MSSRPAGKSTPSAASPAASTYLMFPNPWLWKMGPLNPIWRAFLITIACAGSIDQFRIASTPAALTFVTSAVRSEAALSYTSLARTVIPCSGASFMICSSPALPNPVLLDRTPILLIFIVFICWKILTTASLSFCGVLNTYFATGLTITSAAAQDRRIVFPTSATPLIFIVSPLVEGPMIAKTLSSSMSCLAKENAFSGEAPESLTISSIFLPSPPPFLFCSSTSISRVFASGAPRNDAGPVTDRIAPTLIGSAAWTPAPTSSASATIATMIPFLLLMYPSFSLGISAVSPAAVPFPLSSRKPAVKMTLSCEMQPSGPRPPLQGVDFLPPEHPHPGARQDPDRLVQLVEPENNDRVIPRTLHEGVHVLHVDSRLVQDPQDLPQPARTVRDLEGHHLRLPHRKPVLLQDLLRPVGLVDDQAKDPEIGGVGQGERPDIDARPGENISHLGQPPGLVLQENRNLLDFHRNASLPVVLTVFFYRSRALPFLHCAASSSSPPASPCRRRPTGP